MENVNPSLDLLTTHFACGWLKKIGAYMDAGDGCTKQCSHCVSLSGLPRPDLLDFVSFNVNTEGGQD